MEGIELALRFSYMPNALRYCGPKEAHEHFLGYASNPTDKLAAAVEGDLKRFEGLYPYLSSIAAKAKRHFTDCEVIEAYWLGNSLLDRFSDEDMKSVVVSLVSGGLPRSIAESRSNALPHGMVPHHNFNVFYVGVGQITGAVPTTLANMNSCMISQGVVKEVGNGKLVVSRQPVELDGGRLVFGEEKDVEAEFISAMLPDVKANDSVALHWGFAPLVLTKGQATNLNRYTTRVLDAINSGNHFLETASL